MRHLEQLQLPPILPPWLGLLLLLLALMPPRADGQPADHGRTKPESYRDLACDYYNKADYENCISNCLKAIHQNPRDAWTYDIRALARGDKGDLDGAIADFRSALRLDPTYANAYADCGWFFLHKKHDLRVALADYNEAIRLDPTNVDDYVGRAEVYLAQTNFDQALNDYNTAIQLQPNNAEMFLDRGNAYRDHNELDRALNDYNTAVQVNPTNEIGYFWRGHLLCDLTNYAAAELNYQAFTLSNPTSPAAWSYLGDFHERMTNYTSAIADFTKCIQLEPTTSLYYSIRASLQEESAKVFARLGETNKQQEVLNQALRDHQQAVTLNPEALVGLGRFECRQGHFDQGISDFTLFLQTHPASYGGLTSRAYAYEIVANRMGTNGDVKGQQDALAKALADWNQLVSLKTQEQNSFQCLRGEYYSRNHQYASALSDFHRAMELQPNDYEAQSSLARFLATCPDPAFRDGTNALTIAQKACASDHYDDGWSLATLAAAYAETGDFVQAVKWQNQALVNLEAKDVYGDAFRAEMRDRLTLYEKGQPCRQPLGLDVFFE